MCYNDYIEKNIYVFSLRKMKIGGKVKMRKNNLVVIDMQKDFVNPMFCIPTIPITRDSHQKDYIITSEGKKFPMPHCMI